MAVFSFLFLFVISPIPIVPYIPYRDYKTISLLVNMIVLKTGMIDGKTI